MMTENEDEAKLRNSMIIRFSEVLDSCGTNPLDWPDEERSQLLAFSQSNPRARELLADAHAFDRLLNSVVEDIDVSELHNKILRDIPRDRESDNVISLIRKPASPARNTAIFRSALQSAALLAASLIIGIYVGTTELVSEIYPYLNADADIVSLIPETLYDDDASPEENLL